METFPAVNSRVTLRFWISVHKQYKLRCTCPLSLPEWLAVRVCVFEAHLLELTAPVQLIVAGVRLLPQILHVDSDQHLSEFYKVAVALILNYKGNKHRD